jgi:hypothetical protein
MQTGRRSIRWKTRARTKPFKLDIGERTKRA